MKYSIDGSTLTDIADAIREKTGDTAALTAAAMAEAIAGISGGGGGGLEYESGTFAPTEDVTKPFMSFSKNHSTLPFITIVVDVTNSYSNVANSGYVTVYVNFDALGVKLYPISSDSWQGHASEIARSTSTSSLTIYGFQTNETYSDNGYSKPENYIATDGMYLLSGSSTQKYWRAGRTYKWFAIWAPEE